MATNESQTRKIRALSGVPKTAVVFIIGEICTRDYEKQSSNTLGLSEMVQITVGREEVDFSNLVNRLATEILKGELHLALFLVALMDNLLSSSAKTLTSTLSLEIKKNHKKYGSTHSVS